ncbi:stage II sporulation protein M [Candidatus Pacearchaeota archaeon]|nr:stage II sporulation protein M [Candidatus Pacearchaeota archaeon]
MLEMLLSPGRSERRPWELFFVGIFYATLSVILVNWIFSSDPVLSKYSGILIVTFSVMFSMPYVYYTIRMEENKSASLKGIRLLTEHGKAINAFLWLFVGFIIAFSFWYIILGSPDNFKAQIETYCSINSPQNYQGCVNEYGISSGTTGFVTGNASTGRFFGSIFTNNLYVLIFAVVFSVIFGAGGIFILSWNATVIAAAMVIFAKSDIYSLPLSLSRYMIHGIPEIAAYFIGTLAGGIIGLSIVRKEFRTGRFWDILYDSILLIVIAIVILAFAGLIEVFLTPRLF